jgi:hypothetical protein
MNYFHPQRMPAFPARRREAARRQLEQVIARSIASGRRRKLAVIALGAAVVVVGTGAAAFAVAQYQPVTDTTQARCYTTADPAGTSYTTVADASGPGGQSRVRDAVAVCAGLYRQGFLRVGAAGVVRPTGSGPHSVPRLVACTMSDGAAAVFPGGPATCARLGLPAATRR